MEKIDEKEEIKQENSRIKKWIEEDDNEMNNMVNLYYKL